MQVGHKVAWFGKNKTATFGKVRLKHRELFFGNDVKKATMQVLERSFSTMQRTVGWLRHTEAQLVKDAMQLYFKSGVDKVADVHAKLELVKNGMTSGNLTLKTDNTTAKRSIEFYGDKPDEVDLTEGYVRGMNLGDIHVRRDYITGNQFQAVRVFIHEATHKFASTDDFDEQGYMFADGSDFREPGITADQCLNNADSYAYFCMKLGYH